MAVDSDPCCTLSAHLRLKVQACPYLRLQHCLCRVARLVLIGDSELLEALFKRPGTNNRSHSIERVDLGILAKITQ